MPVLNYEKQAERAVRNFFQDEKISQKNKQIVEKEFLPAYQDSVSSARVQIFMEHLRIFLSGGENIKQEMRDKNRMKELYRKLALDKPRHIPTLINVSKRFCKIINKGTLPISIKLAIEEVRGRVQIKENKRDLDTDDMISWEDGLQIINATNSIQLKAIIAMQLDTGLRPSEFIDLNYGDIGIKNDFLVIRILAGKTGKRELAAWRCVPMVLRWIQTHPSKKQNDPLWTQESQNYGKLKKYQYAAVLKRVKETARKAGIDKPMDFYSLRHSSCYLDKKDNLPIDIAAQRHGHSVKYFAEVYGRLNMEDQISRIKKHNGFAVEEKDKPKPNLPCSRCDFINDPHAEICEKCSAALTVKKAVEIQQAKEEEISSLRNDMQGQINQILKLIDNSEETKIILDKSSQEGS